MRFVEAQPKVDLSFILSRSNHFAALLPAMLRWMIIHPFNVLDDVPHLYAYEHLVARLPAADRCRRQAVQQ